MKIAVITGLFAKRDMNIDSRQCVDDLQFLNRSNEIPAKAGICYFLTLPSFCFTKLSQPE
jgi:hypothetical protein